jgi:mRNA (guanine-N7-)-methyltransferase
MIRENSSYYQLQESVGERRKHVAFGIRQFHNHIKRQLYDAAASLSAARQPIILDLGAGRGGDLPKYRHVKAGKVVGVEKDKHGLDEFRRRLKGTDPVVLLEGDMTTPLSPAVVQPGSVDIVTCQFAMHYAFGDAKAYTTFLSNVHAAVKCGGCFIGTIVDGESMREPLKAKGYATFSLEGQTFADIRAPDVNVLSNYLGASIDVTLASISDLPRREYLVDFDIFSKDLAAIGFEIPPITHHLPAATDLFSADESFSKLHPDEQEYSRLHRYFIFQKTADRHAAVAQLVRRYTTNTR